MCNAKSDPKLIVDSDLAMLLMLSNLWQSDCDDISLDKCSLMCISMKVIIYKKLSSKNQHGQSCGLGRQLWLSATLSWAGHITTSSPGWTIGDGSTGHHDWTINVQWTGMMAPATNLTAPVAWTAHTPAGTTCMALQYDCTTVLAACTSHMPPQHSHSKYINYTKYIMYVVGKEYM